MHKLRLILILLLLSGTAPVASAAPSVVVTIKPIHSLIARVMEGIAAPVLLLTGNQTPHSASLRPSQAVALNEADLVFWVGPELESFLAGPLSTLPKSTTVFPLLHAPDIRRRAMPTTINQQHDGGSHDDHGPLDPHIWLDPVNAISIVQHAATLIAEADPQHAARYADNRDALIAELHQLRQELDRILRPAANKPFLSFHEAFGYFSARFGLQAAGSLAVNPEVSPGARRIRAIQQQVQSAEIICVFSEPQFSDKLVASLLDGSSARTAVLDPLGADLEPGTAAYSAILRTMARTMRDCLEPDD